MYLKCSEFHQLYQIVKTDCQWGWMHGDHEGRISFPRRTLSSMTARSSIDKRRQQLQQFMNGLVLLPLPARTRKLLYSFLEITRQRKSRSGGGNSAASGLRVKEPTVIKEGYLVKRSHNTEWLHNWKTRYFRLVDGGLAYYKSELDAQAQGYIRCGEESVCEATTRFSTGLANTYGLVLCGVQVVVEVGSIDKSIVIRVFGHLSGAAVHAGEQRSRARRLGHSHQLPSRGH